MCSQDVAVQHSRDIFSPHSFMIVVEAKVFGQPHISRLWMLVDKRMLHVKTSWQTILTRVAVKFYAVDWMVTKLR